MTVIRRKGNTVNEIQPMDTEVVEQYGLAGYKPDEVAELERFATTVVDANMGAISSIIAAGSALREVKARYVHGTFSFFVEERAKLTMDTAQRYMAASEAIEKYPQLSDNLARIGQTALYILGQNKGVNEAVVEDVTYYAEDQEVTAEQVREFIKKHQPEKEVKEGAKPKKSPYKLHSRSYADVEIPVFIRNCLGTFYAMARETDQKAMQRDKDYKQFMKEVYQGKPEELTGLQNAVRLMGMAAFILDRSQASEPIDVTPPPTNGEVPQHEEVPEEQTA